MACIEIMIINITLQFWIAKRKVLKNLNRKPTKKATDVDFAIKRMIFKWPNILLLTHKCLKTYIYIKCLKPVRLVYH